MDTMQDDAMNALADLTERGRRERARFITRQPKRASDVIAQLMIRRGYGRFESNRSLQESWADAVGPALAKAARIGKVRRGVLDVVVANSVLLQELKFIQQQLLQRLAELEPEQNIRSLRFTTGNVD